MWAWISRTPFASGSTLLPSYKSMPCFKKMARVTPAQSYAMFRPSLVMVFAPTSLAALRTMANRFGPGSAAWQQVRLVEIDGLGRAADPDDSADSIRADGCRVGSGAVVQPTSVVMATVVIINNKRMHMTV